MILFLILVVTGICGSGKGRAKTTDTNRTLYIDSPEQLISFAREVNEGNTYRGMRVALAGDLDMSGCQNFTPIGRWDGENFFYGVFDGQGHTIRNLTILPEGEAVNLGLFGVLGGIICNLKMENCYIEGNACGAFCSIAADDAQAAILNCEIKNVEIEAPFTNLIGGQYFGIAENCVIDGEGDVETLNSKLRRLHDVYELESVCVWSDSPAGVALSEEPAYLPAKSYLLLDGMYEGELYPLYEAEEDSYIFCVPSMSGSRNATLVLQMPDGRVLDEEVRLPDTGEMAVEAGGERYQFQFRFSENTATVFLDLTGMGGFEYLKESQEHMLPGIIQVLDETGQRQYVGQLERVRGRGNDSWTVPKQSFGLKLTNGGNILNMGKDKDYILLPGYRDASLLTYRMVWDMCREMQWEHALSGELVQLYADGNYCGLYFLTEKIETGAVRIPLQENGAPSGGFVLEFDMSNYEEPDVRIVTDIGNSYTFASPVAPTEEQQEYCRSFWNAFEEALYDPMGYNAEGKHYTEYIDLESFAAQWLFYELNGEVSVRSSVYFYKDAENTKDDRIHAYQPWDVEHSCAFMDIVHDRRMWSSAGLWQALSSHEDFAEEVRRQWEQVYLPMMEKVLAEDAVSDEEGVSSLSYYVERYRAASELNELRWGEEQNMAAKEAGIREWMNARIPYLQENLYKEEYFRE